MKFFKYVPSFLLTLLLVILFFGLFKFVSAFQSSPVSIIWQNLVDVIPSGNTITKTTPNGWGAGASGASSTQYIPTGYEGYVEFRMTNNAGMAGLSNGDPDADYPSLDYAIQAGPNYGSSVVVYENGIQKATSPLLYSSSDVYRVALESGVVKYYHNGTLIHASSVPPTYPLLFDSALYANGGQIQDVVIAISPVSSVPPGENRPPKISNVKVTNITQTGATVTWNTDKASDSQVEYCTTASRCGVSSTLSAGLVTSHAVNLSGLTSSTYYFIWVKSRDGTGNLGVLGYYLFTTTSGIATTPTNTVSPIPVNLPVISNIQVTNITRDSATVTWDTDRPTDSQAGLCSILFYCNMQIFSPTLGTSHAIVFSGLGANRKYRFRVAGSDLGGSTGYSGIATFQTVQGLIMSNLQTINVTSSGATIVWDTNYPANSRVYVCTFFIFCYFSAPVAIDTLMTSRHSLDVYGLNSDRSYSFMAVSLDNFGYRVSQRGKLHTGN